LFCRIFKTNSYVKDSFLFEANFDIATLLLNDIFERIAKMTEYLRPWFLEGKVSQKRYERWLYRKAYTHVRRDGKKGAYKKYRDAIHRAVKDSEGIDAYTKEPLKWKQLGTFDNEKAKKRRRKYKQSFSMLPTVDHAENRKRPEDFKICAWRTNDAKSDLTYDDFLELCKKIINAAS
jgi:hypothetical protein